MNAVRNLKLFFRQNLDQISDYDLVAEHSNSWRELEKIDHYQRTVLLKELESRTLTSDTKALIQQLFVSGKTDSHRMMVKISGISATISTIIFLIIDAYLIPDLFWFAFIVKVLILMPLGLYTYIFSDGQRPNSYLLHFTVFVCIELMLVGFMSLSKEPMAWVYGYGIAAVCVSANVMESLPTRKAVITTGVSLVLATIGFVFNSSISFPVMILSLATTHLICLFSLNANYRLEVVLRRQYVNALREKLQVESLVEKNKELNEHALVDSVTGIGNRRFLDTKIASYFTAFSVSKQHVGVLMVDIDQFKVLNDRHGHVVGDICLRKIAEILSTGIRSATDLVARYGGEEFIIVLPGASAQECYDLAQRLRIKIEKTPILVEGAVEPIVLTVCIGCHAAVPTENGTIIEFVERADAALYKAKRQGRNCVILSGLNDGEHIANAV